MKRVVITGATGMIGIALINRLLKSECEILAIIRKNSERKKFLPKNNRIRVIEYNLDEFDLINTEELSKYDVFFHFAWTNTTSEETRNLIELQNMNIQYTLDAVRLAKRLGCKRFIGAGSQSEFGIIDGIIDNNTIEKPNPGYGEAKYRAGIMSRALANELGLEHIWTRIFSVYGPFDNLKTMVMESIIKMLTKNESPEYTPAEQMWNYIFSEDLAEALDLIAQKGKNNKVYCVANNDAKKLYEYIKIIRNVINPEIFLKLAYLPYRENQVMNLQVDISELTEDTGFIPKTSFESGIVKTINWYKENFI